MPTHTSDEWKDIVGAIEQSVPLYESVSERISFNLAGPLRRRAIAQLGQDRGKWVLDAGVGPGVSCRLLVSQGFRKIVGLDPSRTLLRFARQRLGREFDPVVAVAENLPFRDGSIASSITCFALRDVRDPGMAISEFSRVVCRNGRLCIVDIGKPDSLITRELISFYIHHLMPRLALVLIHRRIKGNPFWMIVPTFDRLLTNRNLENLTSSRFGPSRLSEFMFGGLILVSAERSRT